MTGFPRLYAAASLKLHHQNPQELVDDRFSAALCRGLIEARSRAAPPMGRAGRFPRLYAAASLKHARARGADVAELRFSAALCRGLIEAGIIHLRGLLRFGVFRGFMPRPH